MLIIIVGVILFFIGLGAVLGIVYAFSKAALPSLLQLAFAIIASPYFIVKALIEANKEYKNDPVRIEKFRIMDEKNAIRQKKVEDGITKGMSALELRIKASTEAIRANTAAGKAARAEKKAKRLAQKIAN